MSHPSISPIARIPVPAEPAPAYSEDEFSPLLEVVVGVADDARIPPLDRSAWLNLYPDLDAAELARVTVGRFPSRVLAETADDLDGLAALLESLGVRVVRPAPVAHDLEFATPWWRTSGFYSYCPRDLAIVVGSTIIAAPSPVRARMFELAGLRELFQQRMLAGSAWIAAPPPRLLDDLYLDDGRGRIALGETEPVFDAANILRCGRDLFYQISSSGNELGYRWLKNTVSALGDYRVHPIRGIYPYTHIDSTISLLREGLVLLNPERIHDPAQLPEPLRSWEHLWCPPMAHDPAPPGHPLSSEWIGMNLLMVRPDLAVVDVGQTELIAALRRRGIDVAPHRLRHARTMGGGFHCVTLDLRREHGRTRGRHGVRGSRPRIR
ncbi:scyllo-inosamine-4-phosphate amidinotransferase [Nocardia sp. NPDC051832]|uniref:scyllo-inosamine-4-phosphate amidinotransferase n=1 Tax=Nocardia sp. NPDC051832 TaxID=3155673 RepID=UPI0034213A60